MQVLPNNVSGKLTSNLKRLIYPRNKKDTIWCFRRGEENKIEVGRRGEEKKGEEKRGEERECDKVQEDKREDRGQKEKLGLEALYLPVG